MQEASDTPHNELRERSIGSFLYFVRI